jgi:hypothetical protein
MEIITTMEADYHAQHRQDCPQLALEQVAHSHAD